MSFLHSLNIFYIHPFPLVLSVFFNLEFLLLHSLSMYHNECVSHNIREEYGQ